ncbi:MAG: DUF111 family protein, partial [Nitrososphaerota archaeon]|nr:DUF111 family protein [Nitrososphaerota archaeon]
MRFTKDRVAILETNVDDVSGEVVSRAIERLMNEGALDVITTPFAGKKGRTGHTIRITATPSSVNKMAEIMFEETGTLGMKTIEYDRLMVPRTTHVIPFKLKSYHGTVSVKVANNENSVRIKPEFSQAREISERTGVSVREVIDLITES